MEILPIGKLMKVDKDGFLVNESSKDRIVSPWKEVVKEMVDITIKNIGNGIHSIYLRGSVSRGQAIENISDIDLIILLDGDASKTDRSFLKQTYDNLSQKYPFSTGFEFFFVSVEQLLNSENYYSLRFLIKTCSTCVYGKDISEKIPLFKPNKEVAKHFHRNLGGDCERAKKFIEEGSDIEQWCMWIMKRIVRGGFILVMDKVGSFTRDLYPCYESFSKFYPEKSDDMRKALEMAIEPTKDKEAILSVINGLGEWLTNKIENEFSEK